MYIIVYLYIIYIYMDSGIGKNTTIEEERRRE